MDDTLSIDSTLFGDILHDLGIDTFIVDILVGDTRPSQLLKMIHSDSNKSFTFSTFDDDS